MSHLGQRLSALIDGELGDAERDRVLAHLARCDACRQDAIALRALKQRMHSLGEAMVNAALTGRLMAVGAADGPGPRAPWRIQDRVVRAPPARGRDPGLGGGRPRRGRLLRRRRPAGARPEGNPGGGHVHDPARQRHRRDAGDPGQQRATRRPHGRLGRRTSTQAGGPAAGGTAGRGSGGTGPASHPAASTRAVRSELLGPAAPDGQPEQPGNAGRRSRVCHAGAVS